MKPHSFKNIESEQNVFFKNLKKLLTSRGIKKQGRALLSGKKQIAEVLSHFPDLCEAWISKSDRTPPPMEAPRHLYWIQLTPGLFDTLDVLGTHAPLLLVRIKKTNRWTPQEGFPRGCSLLIPFQDPENVGAAIRSAAAFGAAQVILLAESANPFLPKALRSSGGTVFHVKLLQGPPLKELPATLPIMPLSPGGKDIASVSFPDSFGLLPGLEGPGLPAELRDKAISIPMRAGVESLNASAATTVALYLWSQTVKVKKTDS